MGPLRFAFGVHIHQPVGNFDHVVEQHVREAYRPLLERLSAGGFTPFSLHVSGPLLEWLEAHDAAFIDLVGRLAADRKIELLLSGYDEPILCSLPRADRVEQIGWMRDAVVRLFGAGAENGGLWLTERVWEPDLAGDLAAAGVRYALVDDRHFLEAGFPRKRLHAPYWTEGGGRPVALLSIDERLRYLVPFKPPTEILGYLEKLRGAGHRLAVLADDGEKFGGWPGTREWVFERGWLSQFLEVVAGAVGRGELKLVTCSEALAEVPSGGIAYLPSASYSEMERWALPPEAARHLAHLERELGEHRLAGPEGALVRGTHWRSFLARYPESNRMHKRMTRASARLEADARRGSADWIEARTHLWRSQCNDAYWHGIFGGLYLPHLRGAVYRELIAAERFLTPPHGALELGDPDFDGREDAVLETPEWAAWIGSRGGSLWGFDDRARGVNYIDTLARREEYYHRRLPDAGVGGGDGESIHARVTLKEPGLAKLATQYDARPRDAFLDQWVEGGVTTDLGDTRWSLERTGEAGVTARVGPDATPVIEKRYAAAADGALEVEYALHSDRPRLGRLVVTIHLGLHVPDAPDRYVELDGERAQPPELGARARHDGVMRAAFVDGWARRRLQIWTDRRAAIERAPIETVSLSEAGAERVFQGLEARWSFAVAIESGQAWRLRFRVAPGGLASEA